MLLSHYYNCPGMTTPDEVAAWICCAWPGFGARFRGTGAQGRVCEPFFDRDRAGPASASCAAVLIGQVWQRVPKNLYNDDDDFPESLLASTPTRPVVVMTRNAPPHRIGPANRNQRHGRKTRTRGSPRGEITSGRKSRAEPTHGKAHINRYGWVFRLGLPSHDK